MIFCISIVCKAWSMPRTMFAMLAVTERMRTAVSTRDATASIRDARRRKFRAWFFSLEESAVKKKGKSGAHLIAF